MTPRSVYEQAEQTGTYPWDTIFFSWLILLGPFMAVAGIPLLIIGVVRTRRQPSKLMRILKSNAHMRTRAKISFLAEQLGTNERDVIGIIYRLRSSGQPISVDLSTFEAIYNPASSPTAPPSPSITRPRMEAKPEQKPVPTPVPLPTREQKTSRAKAIIWIVCSLPVVWAGGIFLNAAVGYISGLQPNPIYLLICGLPLIFGLPLAFWKRTRPWAEIVVGLWVFGAFSSIVAWIKSLL